jgi:hypothetical protein
MEVAPVSFGINCVPYISSLHPIAQAWGHALHAKSACRACPQACPLNRAMLTWGGTLLTLLAIKQENVLYL